MTGVRMRGGVHAWRPTKARRPSPSRLHTHTHSLADSTAKRPRHTHLPLPPSTRVCCSDSPPSCSPSAQAQLPATRHTHTTPQTTTTISIMARIAGSLVAVLFAAAAAAAAAGTAEHVKVLSAADYDDSVNDGNVYFIKFFAPWCGHCKRLAPTWGDLAEAVKDNPAVKIAQVDCTVDRDVCSNADVKGYPSLRIYHKGEEVKAYRGARDLDSLKAYVEEAAAELLTETTE